MKNVNPLRIGCCCDAVHLADVRSDFEYVEITISVLEDALQSGQDPASVAASLPAPPEVVMGMFPRDMPMLGPDANSSRLRDRARFVIDLAARAGASQLVLGAGKVRSIPDTMSTEDGLAELAVLLQDVAAAAAKVGLRFAIENIAPPASNVFNRLPEIAGFLDRYDLQTIGVTFDTAQAELANDPLDGLLEHAAVLQHVHVPVPCPAVPKILTVLEKVGYRGRISVEPPGLKVDAQAHATARALRSYLSGN